MDHPVRVRFAPSPTGSIHIGSARTALFNWLFARHYGGRFILRIEDTDQNRFVQGSLEQIIDGLRWLGLDWDEGPEVGGEYGPYIQSARTELYREWANWLVDQDRAYRCYCTRERLKSLSDSQDTQGYDRHCRYLTAEDHARKQADGESYVIRFKMPLEGTTTVHDVIRGDITVENSGLTDLVLMKADGFPTYHLANVVDDHFMEISHILRGEEWIPTAPVHKRLYDAFGWEMPIIAHLPVILNPNGKGKLSKRTVSFTQDGRKVLVLLHEFRQAGYLPEALINFLTNIGWSFGDDREIFTITESAERFDLSRINPAGGRFPMEKLGWLNGVYLRQKSLEEMVSYLRTALEGAGYQDLDEEMLQHIAPLIQTRVQCYEDVVARAGFFFMEVVPVTPETLIQDNMTAEMTDRALVATVETLENLPEFETQSLEEALRSLAEALGLKTKQLFGVLRVALTGQTVAPPLFETMAILGRQTTLKRLQAAQQTLSKPQVES